MRSFETEMLMLSFLFLYIPPGVSSERFHSASVKGIETIWNTEYASKHSISIMCPAVVCFQESPHASGLRWFLRNFKYQMKNQTLRTGKTQQ